MAKKFLDQLGGVICVCLRGKKPEKVINLALTRGIYIWDIKKSAEGIDFKVKSSAYEALKTIADENAYVLEITRKEGLPIFKNIARRRLGFIGGALIFVLALYLMSSFIWFIELSGNKKVDANHIILTAARHGVYRGAAKWDFSRNEVEEAILRDISELSYVKLDIRGVKARIEVVEKVFPREEINGPCDIVAAKEGVIAEVLVLDGQAKVEEGDVVAKGDILISGVVFPQISPYIYSEESDQEVEPYLTRARGMVKAHVWYEGYGECKLNSEKTVLTGREISKIYIETPGKDIIVKGRRETGFPLAKEKVSRKTIRTPFGEFGIYRVLMQEQIKENLKYTETEAVEIARKKAMQSMQKRISNLENPYDVKVDILSLPSDPILRIKVMVENIEDIASVEPINMDQNSN